MFKYSSEPYSLDAWRECENLLTSLVTQLVYFWVLMNWQDIVTLCEGEKCNDFECRKLSEYFTELLATISLRQL